MDECRNNPCGVGAQCTNIPGGYRCSCAPGFERNPSLPANLFGTIQLSASTSNQANEMINSSLVACLDVNECAATPNGKPVCGTGAQCINTPGGYFCQCPPNYTGNPKVACLDIDECAAHVCGPNAQCKNLPGSYKCECKQGYTGKFTTAFTRTLSLSANLYLIAVAKWPATSGFRHARAVDSMRSYLLNVFHSAALVARRLFGVSWMFVLAHKEMHLGVP